MTFTRTKVLVQFALALTQSWGVVINWDVAIKQEITVWQMALNCFGWWVHFKDNNKLWFMEPNLPWIQEESLTIYQDLNHYIISVQIVKVITSQLTAWGSQHLACIISPKVPDLKLCMTSKKSSFVFKSHFCRSRCPLAPNTKQAAATKIFIAERIGFTNWRQSHHIL